MTLIELKHKIDTLIDEGYGEKIICVDGQPDLEIDSVQSNRNPGFEPDYYIILTSGDFNAPED